MDNEKLKKLKDLMAIASEGLTRQEFLDSFKKILDHLAKLEAKLVTKIDGNLTEEKEQLAKLRREFNRVIEEAKAESDNSLSGFKRKTVELVNSLFAKSKVNQKLNEVMEEVDFKLRQIDDKMSEVRSGFDGKDGADGKDADEDAVAQKVLAKIEIPEVDKTELEELKKEIEELKKRPVGRLGGGGFSYIAMDQHFVDDETPSGVVNGVTTAFTIANTPNPAGSLKVYVNGQRMRLTEDYTFSGRIITFVTAPPTGSILLVDYRK